MSRKTRNYVKYFFPLLLLVFVSFNFSFAASLQLQKIGNLDLGGKTYPEWWYTGENPVFYGVSAGDSAVNIKIDDSSFSTTSDSSGNWSYVSQLSNGDHEIEISQGSEKIVFTLHLGQSLPENIGAGTQEATASGSSVPSTGFNQYVAISMGVGVVLLATYLYFSSDSKGKRVFENRMIKED